MYGNYKVDLHIFEYNTNKRSMTFKIETDRNEPYKKEVVDLAFYRQSKVLTKFYKEKIIKIKKESV